MSHQKKQWYTFLSLFWNLFLSDYKEFEPGESVWKTLLHLFYIKLVFMGSFLCIWHSLPLEITKNQDWNEGGHFPGGAVVKNPPANAEGTDLIPGPGV